MSKESFIARAKKFLEWPGFLWVGPLIFTAAAGVGALAYKAYVGDPLLAVNTKIEAVTTHLDKVETNVTQTGKEVSAANAKLDVLLNRNHVNAGYTSKQDDGVYKVSR